MQIIILHVLWGETDLLNRKCGLSAVVVDVTTASNSDSTRCDHSDEQEAEGRHRGFQSVGRKGHNAWLHKNTWNKLTIAFPFADLLLICCHLYFVSWNDWRPQLCCWAETHGLAWAQGQLRMKYQQLVHTKRQVQKKQCISLGDSMALLLKENVVKNCQP
jgi:hypothetical protein